MEARTFVVSMLSTFRLLKGPGCGSLCVSDPREHSSLLTERGLVKESILSREKGLARDSWDGAVMKVTRVDWGSMNGTGNIGTSRTAAA